MLYFDKKQITSGFIDAANLIHISVFNWASNLL